MAIAPLALGGRADWFADAVVAVNSLAFALLLVEKACTRRALRWNPCWAVAGLVLLITLLQLIPANTLISLVSSSTSDVWNRARNAGLTDLRDRLSLAPLRTAEAIKLLSQILLAGYLVYNTYTSKKSLPYLSFSIAAAALIASMAGLLPSILGIRAMFAELGIDGSPLSGPYYNRNHFSLLIALGLTQLMAISWCQHRTNQQEREGKRKSSGNLGALRRGQLILFLLALASVPMVMALMLSLSRGGVVATAISVGTFLAMTGKGTSRRRRWRKLAFVCFVAAVTVFGSMEALSGLWGRYERLLEAGNVGMEGRWLIWTETAELIRRFPITGVGLDAFGVASPLVESGFIPGKVSGHAHNDYLELVAEVGLPLGIIFLGLLFFAATKLGVGVVRSERGTCRTLATGAFAALIGLAAHEIVEYNLRAPANALIAVGLAVLCLLARELGDADRKKSVSEGRGVKRRSMQTRKKTGMEGFRGPVFGIGAALVLLFAMLTVPARIQAGRKSMELRKYAALNGQNAVMNSGNARRVKAVYCTELATHILRIAPRHRNATAARARYLDVVTEWAIRNQDSERPLWENRVGTETYVQRSLAAAFEACRWLPSHGLRQGLYARKLDIAAWFDKSIRIPAVIAAYETAHQNAPNSPQVTLLALQGLNHIARVDDDVLPPEEISRLKKRSAELGGRLMDQQPEKAGEIFDLLLDSGIPSGELVAITPRRLLCLDPLFDVLIAGGWIDDAEHVIQTMAEVNATRTIRTDAGDATLYQLARTYPASREEVRADLARKRLAVAALQGNWENYRVLRDTDREERRKVVIRRLEELRAAVAEGRIHQATGAGLRLASKYSDVPEARVEVASWLVTLGEYEKAAHLLEPLMWNPPHTTPLLRQALKVSALIPPNATPSQDSQLISMVLQVMLAEIVEQGAHLSEDQLGDLATELAARSSSDHMLGARLVYPHLAAHYAGRLAMTRGKSDEALEFFAKTLKLCPLHAPTLLMCKHIIEADKLGELCDQWAELQQKFGFTTDDLTGDLIEVSPGLTLRAIRISPSELTPTGQTQVIGLIEVTGRPTTLPRLWLRFIDESGTEIGWEWTAAGDGDRRSEKLPKPGQLLKVGGTLIPARLSIAEGKPLANGKVRFLAKGGGRDRGLTLQGSAFTIASKNPKSL